MARWIKVRGYRIKVQAQTEAQLQVAVEAHEELPDEVLAAIALSDYECNVCRGIDVDHCYRCGGN